MSISFQKYSQRDKRFRLSLFLYYFCKEFLKRLRFKNLKSAT